MRLLIVNSNTTQGITDRIEEAARAAARPITRITAVTAAYGPPGIETPEDVEIAADATREAILYADDPPDAAIIACFSDPGLMRIRAEVPFPVIGIAQAAMQRACEIGARFSILTVAPSTVPGIRNIANSYGMQDRLAGIHALDQHVVESHRDPERTIRNLAALAQSVLKSDAPDVLVLGGAVTAGVVPHLAADLSLPVIDGLTCAIEQAELSVP